MIDHNLSVIRGTTGHIGQCPGSLKLTEWEQGKGEVKFMHVHEDGDQVHVVLDLRFPDMGPTWSWGASSLCRNSTNLGTTLVAITSSIGGFLSAKGVG